MKNNPEVVVIGAGFAGISAALYLQRAKFNVTLLESHYRPGGCASFYKRGRFRFDTGATTLSGMQPGRPVRELLEMAELSPRMFDADPGITVHLQGKVIRLGKYFENTLAELKNTFPEIHSAKFWHKLFNIDRDAFNILKLLPAPPASLREAISFIPSLSFKALQLAVKMLLPARFALSKQQRESKVFLQFLDQLTIISLQNDFSSSPWLSAALGVIYPHDMMIPEGGPGYLAEQLLEVFERRGGKLKYKTQVSQIQKSESGFTVLSQKGEHFSAEQIVITTPVWNAKDFFDLDRDNFSKTIFKKLNRYANKFKPYWGAFTFNFAATGKFPTGCYHQVHTDNTLSFGGDSIFITFSHPDDKIKAPEGTRTVTISTHTELESWTNISEEEILYRRQLLANQIKILFTKHFPETQFLKFEHNATPQTFLNFTSRYKGSVGGIPHRAFEFHRMPSSVLHKSGIYLAGDTAFPGQGIVSVIHSGKRAADLICKSMKSR